MYKMVIVMKNEPVENFMIECVRPSTPNIVLRLIRFDGGQSGWVGAIFGAYCHTLFKINMKYDIRCAALRIGSIELELGYSISSNKLLGMTPEYKQEMSSLLLFLQ